MLWKATIISKGWIFFGKEEIITENDPEQQEKRVKYLHLVASAVILHNAVESVCSRSATDGGGG